MRLLQILSCFLFVQGVVAQDEVKVIQPTTEMGGTVFASYDDASTFLHGLIDVESDNYGNLVFYRKGTASQRAAYRLTDVVVVAKETPSTMNNGGGQTGPRIEISAKCVSGPCIVDPAMRDGPAMEESSIFFTDFAKGRKVYSTLLVMQRFLEK